MTTYCAVYVMLSGLTQQSDNSFVRFFQADDLDHAYDQAKDSTEEGEYLAAVTGGDVRTR